MQQMCTTHLLILRDIYSFYHLMNKYLKSNRKKISIKLRMSKELKLIKKQILKPLNWIICFN